MNNLINLDSLDGLDFEDDFDDILKDNSFEKQFKSFFNFLNIIKEFVVDMDITNMKIGYYTNQQKQLLVDFDNFDNYTNIITKVNNLLNESPSNLKDFGYVNICFYSIEYDSDKKEYIVQICREQSKKYYEDSDLYFTYNLSEILSYLNNREDYINKKICEDMLELLRPTLYKKYSYLLGAKSEYLEGRDYMINQFFFEDRENGEIHLDKVMNCYNRISSELEKYKTLLYGNKNE